MHRHVAGGTYEMNDRTFFMALVWPSEPSCGSIAPVFDTSQSVVAIRMANSFVVNAYAEIEDRQNC